MLSSVAKRVPWLVAVALIAASSQAEPGSAQRASLQRASSVMTPADRLENPSIRNAGAARQTIEVQNQSRTASARIFDTASVHNTLRDAINDFQDKWRGKWQSVELKRHRPIALNDIRGYNVRVDGTVEPPFVVGDRERGNLTPELRRYLQILCYVGTPSDKELEEAKWNAARLDKQIIRSAAGAERLAATRAHAEESRAKAEAIVAAGTNVAGPTSAQTKAPPSPDPKAASASEQSAKITPGGVSWATTRLIVPRPNTGAICPSWLPPDQNIPLDEGEAIDLAIPIKERAPLRAQREKLLTILDAAQKENPDDSWITGQRVRFFFDQRDTTRALAAANECRGNEAWCLSLKGIALQQTDNLLAAEKVFRQAEAVLPTRMIKDSLCGNAEALMLLNHDDRDVVAAKSCDEQHAMIDRMWWLADPLWSVPGNERYVAHNVRKVQATLRAVTDRDERYVWAANGGGAAMRELVVRYGWPSYTYWAGRQLDDELNKYREFGYEKNQFRTPPYTAKEYTADRAALLPSGKALIDPFSLRDDAWQLYAPTADVDRWWPQEHYYYPTHLAALNVGQDIMWRRDTSITYQLAIDDPLRNLDTATTALSKAVLMGGDGPVTTRQLAQSVIGAGYTLRFLANLRSAPLVMSAEVLPRTLVEQGMRRRYGVRPPPTLREMQVGEVALSEPLFMRMPNRTMPVPIDQQNVLRYMAGDLTFTRDEPLALYWESYGFSPGDTVNVELKFRHDDDLNVAQRLLGTVGVGGTRDSVSIKWTEPDPRHAAVVLSGAKPVVGRSVAVDLTALEGGTYVVILEMRKGSAVTTRSERRIVIKKRPE